MKISMLQRLCVLASAIFAVAFAYLQATGALGLSPAEFANNGASTVRAASYAFAIWGLIYAGLLIYSVYQLVPAWANGDTLRHYSWPSVVSMLAIGAWLVAAGADWRWMTVALIILAAIVLIVPLTAAPKPAKARDTLLVVTPLALLAGWLTIASALNTVTVLTSEGFVAEDQATWCALGSVTAAVLVALYVTIKSRQLAYPIPIVWGLAAVFVAEQTHRPPVAWFAVGAAMLLAIVAVWRALTPKPA